MNLHAEPASERYAGQLNVVKLCHDYAVLDVHDQVGLRLSRAERRMLVGLRRLLEGDPTRQRRRHRRLPLMLKVTLSAGLVDLVGTAINVSGGGMYVMAPGGLSVGTPVELTLGETRDGGEKYTFQGTVQWQRQHGELVGLGIQFRAVPLARQWPGHGVDTTVAGNADVDVQAVA